MIKNYYKPKESNLIKLSIYLEKERKSKNKN